MKKAKKLRRCDAADSDLNVLLRGHPAATHEAAKQAIKAIRHQRRQEFMRRLNYQYAKEV